MADKLKGNIWKYAILLIANKRIFVAVLGSYYLTIPGVTPKIIGTILLAGSLAGFVFEIPSGYMSDKIGHKQAIVTSRILMILSTGFFLFATNTILLILGSVFLSMSAAFLSGTGSAFMHETLRGLGKEKDYTKIMGKVSAIGFGVPIIFMVLIPFLVSVSYKTPFIIALIIDLVGLMAAISLVVPPVEQEHVDEVGVTNFKQVMVEGYRLNYFSIALFSAILSGTLFSIGGFKAPYQSFLEIPVIWFGVFFGTGRAFASVLLAYSGRLKERFSLLSFYKFQIVTFSILFLALGISSNRTVVVIAFIITNALHWGFSKIDSGIQLDVIRSSKFKATLLSAGSQIDQIFSALIPFGLGLLIERFSYQRGFLIQAIAFTVSITLMYLYISRRHKSGAYAGVN